MRTGDWAAGIRKALQRFRDVNEALHREVCGALWKLGPPEYTPDYMIWRGEVPLKGDDDWQVAQFDAASAWTRAVSEFNHCSAPERFDSWSMTPEKAGPNRGND